MTFRPIHIFVILIAIIFLSFAVFVCIVDSMGNRLAVSNRQLDFAVHELKLQRFEIMRAKEVQTEVDYLRFLESSVVKNNSYFHQITMAAWRYGRALEKWPTIPNGPALVMAVIHRESFFRRKQVSYIDGRAIAHGPAQINYAVWKDYFDLELDRMDDPDYSIRHAVEILQIYLKNRDGDVSLALWDYWGRGADWSYPGDVLNSQYYEGHK